MAECSFCGSDQIRLARSRGIYEALLEGVGIFPFRCEVCHKRRRYHIWSFHDLFCAKCPHCYGQELGTWDLKHYRPSLKTRLKLALGARRLRCESCRRNFASWLPRKKHYRRRDSVNPLPGNPNEPLETTDQSAASGNLPDFTSTRQRD